MRTDKEIEPTIKQASMSSISANEADGIFLQGIPAIIAAAIISLFAHFAVGAAKTLVTDRSCFHSGLEMTIVGAIEAVITYALGAAFRVVA